MERTDRCALLARLSDRELVSLAGLVVNLDRDDIVAITPPTVGMVMARAEDGARGEVFNLGEVLVTECQVQIGDLEGWSMVQGSRPRGAFAAAAIDAVAGNHPAIDELEGRLALLVAEQDAAAAAERASLATTRVQFDTQ